MRVAIGAAGTTELWPISSPHYSPILVHAWEGAAVFQPAPSGGTTAWVPLASIWEEAPEVVRADFDDLRTSVESWDLVWAPSPATTSLYDGYPVEWIRLKCRDAWRYVSTWHLLRGYFNRHDKTPPPTLSTAIGKAPLSVPGIDGLSPYPIARESVDDLRHFRPKMIAGHEVWCSGHLGFLVEEEERSDRLTLLTSYDDGATTRWQPGALFDMRDGGRVECPPLLLADVLFLIVSRRTFGGARFAFVDHVQLEAA